MKQIFSNKKLERFRSDVLEYSKAIKKQIYAYISK